MKTIKLVTLAKHKKYLVKTYTTSVEISFNNIDGYWSFRGKYNRHERVYGPDVSIYTKEDEPEMFL